ncbi:hypothetical protein JFU37_04745 [Pseudomonas sp. TH41]|uniref:hypothetical protein n=1 Tax=Pseudomonas sp. TH41 TaxID=2796405 RepID=UPI001912B206|nr:hypothetical protein [Pseudomonas sp. TH41]MBK5351820.1 hypothetical protein [Pseudomonas sp. TH41]
MKHHIKLKIGNIIETATLNESFSSLTFSRKNGFKKTYTDHDLYLCLAQIRQEFPDIEFLCKGAKINVFPSRMCSQMSNGAVAYELTMGKQALRSDVVHIFDYEENNLTNDPNVQKDFFLRWVESDISEE